MSNGKKNCYEMTEYELKWWWWNQNWQREDEEWTTDVEDIKRSQKYKKPPRSKSTSYHFANLIYLWKVRIFFLWSENTVIKTRFPTTPKAATVGKSKPSRINSYNVTWSWSWLVLFDVEIFSRLSWLSMFLLSTDLVLVYQDLSWEWGGW